MPEQYHLIKAPLVMVLNCSAVAGVQYTLHLPQGYTESLQSLQHLILMNLILSLPKV